MELHGIDVNALTDSPDEASMIGPMEGVSRFDHDVDLWGPALNTADLDILPNRERNEGKVREMIATDGFSAAGADLYKNHIVGAQFMCTPKPVFAHLQRQDSRLDEVWADEFQDEVQPMFALWAESSSNWPDASRKNTLTSMIRLALGVQLAGGEVMGSVEWGRDQPRPMSTMIQLIENERVATPPELISDSSVRAGIRRNTFGAAQGYYVRKSHPTDFFDARAYEFTYVEAIKPWGRPQFIHLMEQTRINQTRGISKLVASVKEMKIAKRYRDVTLQNAIVNATYAATIESELPPEAAFTSLGGRDRTLGSGAVDFAKTYLEGVANYVKGGKNLHIDGVKIPHLYPGTKLNLNRAGAPGGVGEAFEKSLLRYIAANLGVSYEEFSRDYSSTNYSSIRAAIIETWKQMQSIKKIIADKFASIVYRLWLEEAINNNMITSLPTDTAITANFYRGFNTDAFCHAEWVGAARGQIDELKETQAAVLRLNNNLSTHEDEAARMGKNYRTLFAQKEKEKEDMEKRGIAPQVDTNQMNASTGAVREKEDA